MKLIIQTLPTYFVEEDKIITALFEEGMDVTNEPGIYVEGLGGVRIEDLVAVTENGIENLAHSVKDMIVI